MVCPKDARLILPNLFIPGAGKSGTSSLHEYLGQHPDIFMSREKEPHFFSIDSHYAHGLDWYSGVFADGESASVRGESSTTYLHFPHVVERIAAIIPDPRFIVLLRNPIDRVVSHFRWLVGLGLENRSIREAFLADRDEVPDPSNQIGGNYRYYAAESRYGEHLAEYVSAFGAERVLVLTAEELRREPDATLARCSEFLRIAPFPELEPVWTNPTRQGHLGGLATFLDGSEPQSDPMRALRRRVLPLATRALRHRSIRAARAHLVQTLSRRAAPLNQRDRNWLREYFASDVDRLRRLTARGFEEWAEDFPLPSSRQEPGG